MIETIHNALKPLLLYRYRPFFESGIILPEEDSPVSVAEALESMFYTEYIAKDDNGFFIANMALENTSGYDTNLLSLIQRHKLDVQKLENMLHFNYAIDKLTDKAVKEFIAEHRRLQDLTTP